MPAGDVHANISADLRVSLERGDVTVTLRDEVTQRDYKVTLPLHTLRALRAMIDKAISERPEWFAECSARFDGPLRPL